MSHKLVEIYEDMMTPGEQAELEAFAVFVLARRKLRKQRLLKDDISITDLMQIIEQAGSFDWLASDEENVYSIEEGDAVEWPKK